MPWPTGGTFILLVTSQRQFCYFSPYFVCVVERIMTPPKCPCPYPQTYEYVSLHDNRDITDQIKLKTLDGEVFLDNPGRPNIISRILVGGREAGGSS